MIGPITMSYNLSGVSNLKLSRADHRGHLLGQDQDLERPGDQGRSTPGVSLPSTAITLAVRSDSSGTTAELLPVPGGGGGQRLDARQQLDHQVARPAARAGSGNAGVAQIVKSTPGAIGYVDYADAKASGLTFASVKNKDGAYVAPSPASASAAAGQRHRQARPDVQRDLGSPGASAYPITYQSWVLVYQKQSEREHGEAAQGVHRLPGRRRPEAAPQLGYAPLPASIDQKAKAQLSKIGIVMVSTVIQADQIGSTS